MLKVCDGCKDGLDTDKDGSSISTKWGCARPFRANGAHPSDVLLDLYCYNCHDCTEYCTQ